MKQKRKPNSQYLYLYYMKWTMDARLNVEYYVYRRRVGELPYMCNTLIYNKYIYIQLANDIQLFDLLNEWAQKLLVHNQRPVYKEI